MMKIQGGANGKSEKPPPKVKVPKMIPCPRAKLSETILQTKLCAANEICHIFFQGYGNVAPPKQFKMASGSAHALKLHYGVNHEICGPCHEAGYRKMIRNDTLSLRNPKIIPCSAAFPRIYGI